MGLVGLLECCGAGRAVGWGTGLTEGYGAGRTVGGLSLCSGDRMGVWDRASKTLGMNVPSRLYSFKSTFFRDFRSDKAEIYDW